MQRILEKTLPERLSELLQEEIIHYRELLKEMRKESGYLRQGFLDSLGQSVQSLERRSAQIHRISEAVRDTLEEIFSSRIFSAGEGKEKNWASLMEALPMGERRKIKIYRKTLEELKERVRRTNGWNKSFLRESLSCLQDLLSLLHPPGVEFPVYIHNGQKKSFSSPLGRLNREV